MNSRRVYALGIGYELLQHRSGHAIGRPVGHRPDVIVQGTAEALREEIEQAFTAIRGQEGEAMRRKMGKLAKEIRAKRKGEWENNLKEFVQWGRA